MTSSRTTYQERLTWLSGRIRDGSFSSNNPEEEDMKKGFKVGEIENLRGRTFGRYTVLGCDPISRYIGKEGRQYKQVYWTCQCESCGGVEVVLASNLKRNTSGCFHCAGLRNREKASAARQKYADTNLGVYYNSYKGNAKRRGKYFDLSLEHFESLISEDCFYCGAPPRVYTLGRHKIEANGIDRRDNNIGYTKENCVPCCTGCNVTKGAMTEDMFYKFFSRQKPEFVSSEVMLWLS